MANEKKDGAAKTEPDRPGPPRAAPDEGSSTPGQPPAEGLNGPVLRGGTGRHPVPPGADQSARPPARPGRPDASGAPNPYGPPDDYEAPQPYGAVRYDPIGGYGATGEYPSALFRQYPPSDRYDPDQNAPAGPAASLDVPAPPEAPGPSGSAAPPEAPGPAGAAGSASATGWPGSQAATVMWPSPGAAGSAGQAPPPSPPSEAGPGKDPAGTGDAGRAPGSPGDRGPADRPGRGAPGPAGGAPPPGHHWPPAGYGPPGSGQAPDAYRPEAYRPADPYGAADPYAGPGDYDPADPYGPTEAYRPQAYRPPDRYSAPDAYPAPDAYRPPAAYAPPGPPPGAGPGPAAPPRAPDSGPAGPGGPRPAGPHPGGPGPVGPGAPGQGAPGPGPGPGVGGPGGPGPAGPGPAGVPPPRAAGPGTAAPPGTPAPLRPVPPRGPGAHAAPDPARAMPPPGMGPAGPVEMDAPRADEADEAAGLTPEFLLPGRRRAPDPGWRRIVYRATGGLMRVPSSAAELRRRDMINRVRTPVAGGHHRVAVLSMKGGVGKTTTTVGLGATLASLRGDRVIAVDANPDRGTLSDKVRLETAATVRDLLNERGHVRRYADVRTFTSQAPSRLEVLASDRDPTVSVAFSDQDYSTVARVLEHYYSICLTDCGTGLLHSAMAGVLRLADQIVLVSSPSVDGARSASATLDWLAAHSYGDLVRNAVVVLSIVRPRSKSSVDLNRLEEHFAARCRSVVRIPYDPHLEEGAEVELDLLSRPAADAYLELAAMIGDGLAMPARARRSG